MLPHEVQENIVKVLFFVFAIIILCLSKARAYETLKVVDITVITHSVKDFSDNN